MHGETDATKRWERPVVRRRDAFQREGLFLHSDGGCEKANVKRLDRECRASPDLLRQASETLGASGR